MPDKYRREIELLQSMPGVGDITSPVIMAEIVNIRRFDSPEALCKYAGLVPRVIQSGESDRRGRLVKQSSAILRTAMIQCAHGVILTKYDNKLKHFFVQLSRRKKFNTAVAALAHKMLYIMWFMLTNNEEFHD
ncbi:Transposase, IS116/IS110/IS902, partial [mine drainage metagenome]